MFSSKIITVLLSISTFISLLLSPWQLGAQSTLGNWQAEVSSDGSLPDQRHEAGYVELNGKFYLLGGRGNKPVNIYDPLTRTWTDGAYPPIEIHHFQPVAFQGKIYALCAMTGGYPNETPLPNVLIYDPALDQWSTGDAIPSNRRRGSAGVVVYNNEFYIVSGIQNGHQSGHVTWMDKYNPTTGNWTTLPNAPRARDHFQASYVNGKIYAVGGRTSIASQGVFGNTIKEVDVYDLSSGQWSTLANDLPTERAGCFNAVLGNELLVIGGESLAQSTAHSETEALNVLTGNWRSLTPMIQGRHGSGAAFLNDTIYVASGSGNRGGGPELTTQEYFTFGMANQPPTLSTITDRMEEEGTAVNFQVLANDPDGDNLSYQASGLPSGININSTSGIISGTLAPGTTANSPYSVTVSISDGNHPAVSTSFTWEVYYLDCAGTVNGPAVMDTCGQCLLLSDPNFNICFPSQEYPILYGRSYPAFPVISYPNPLATGTLKLIPLDQQWNSLKATLINEQGQEILSFSRKNQGQASLTIESLNLAQGIYFLFILTDGGRYAQLKIRVDK